MSKDAVFTMKLESELRNTFMLEAESENRSASQIVRELMAEYIEQRREAREYEQYVQSKIAASRNSMRAGVGRSNIDVEATFAAKRKQLEANQE